MSYPWVRIAPRPSPDSIETHLASESGGTLSWTSATLDQVFDACGLHWASTENLIICRQCQYALSPSVSQIIYHLLHKHQVLLPIRRSLTSHLQRRERRLQEPGAAAPCPDRLPSDPYLQLYEDYACRQCDFRTVNHDTIRHYLFQIHLQQQHATQRPVNNLYNDVFLQTWTQSPARHYWIVAHQGNTIRTPPVARAVNAYLATVYQRERERLQAEERESGIAAGSPAADSQLVECTRPWMDRTGWPRVYQGVHRGLLQGLCDLPYRTTGRTDLLLGHDQAGELIISPAADKARLRHLMLAMDSVLDRCEETLQQTSRRARALTAPFGPMPGRAAARTTAAIGSDFWSLFSGPWMDPQSRQQLTGIRFRRPHLALLRQIWEHRMWDNLDTINKLEQLSQRTPRSGQRRAQTSFPEDPHNSSDMESDEGSLTDVEEDETVEEKD
ncbi:hypothetical protein BDV23DRAFT_189349 [Aspergillus alliaceus]|uniref:Uncharacterized protein n=1 Tax=Petromyces alliaceus TaxID=209559 RepID=A0A5N7BRB3_PETAA|nr:hypothetical protein BDV23DRAFT_189349 [Aspergillus alliaceus]